MKFSWSNKIRRRLFQRHPAHRKHRRRRSRISKSESLEARRLLAAAATLTLSESALHPGNLSVIQLELANDSTTEEITEFSLSIGDTSYIYDFATDEVGQGLTFQQILPTNDNNDSLGYSNVAYSFNGFSPNESFTVGAIDVDFNMDSSQDLPWTEVLLNNGTLQNAVVSVEFSSGVVLARDLPDGTGTLSVQLSEAEHNCDDSSLTHYYSFETDASDSVGSNNGQLMGGASIVSDPVRGNVLELDGIDDYVLLSGSNLAGGGGLATDAFSFSGWVKLDGVGGSTSANTGIYGEYVSGGTSQKNTVLVTKATGTIGYSQYPPSGGDINSPTTLVDNTWHHIAYVQNEAGGDQRKLYVDGVLVANDNLPENYAGSVPDIVTIGARFGYSGSLEAFASYVTGRIDDIAFYDKALSVQQVAALASGGAVLCENIVCDHNAESGMFVSERTIIDDNFSSRKSADILTFKGNAKYDGLSYITLTPAATGKKGTVIIDSHQERALDFNFSMDYSIKNGNGADGFGIGYGNLSGGAFGEKGERSTRDGLWIEMDTYRGSAGNAKLEVWYNKSKLYGLSLPTSAFRGNLRDMDLTMRHSGSTGILTLKHSSSLIGTRTITVPNWNPQSSWRWGIGARTGARYDWHVLENLVIKDVTGSQRPDAEVTFVGAGFFRDDSEGASWNWSTSDINGDLRQVDLILRNASGQIIRTETQTGGFRRDAGATSGTFAWLPTDGIGELTLELVAYDQYGCSHQISSPVTIVDDDTQGPEIRLTYGTDNLLLNEPVTQSHGVENSISWAASDLDTGNSGVYPVNIEIQRDGQLIDTLTGLNSGTVFLDPYGIGVFDVSITALDGDVDRGAVDQAATTATGQITVTNTAPKLEAGLDRTAKEGELVTFTVPGVVDADGETPDYSWDFGDGNTLNGPTVSFVFPEQGIYPVTVTATDAFGATATDTLVVDVSNADPKIVSVTVTDNAQPGQPVDFTVLASDVAADTRSYSYDFTSDGNVDVVGGDTARHLYTQAGLYTATIRVADEDGGEAVAYVTVPVGINTVGLPQLQFTTAQTILNEDSPVANITARLSGIVSFPIEIPISVAGSSGAEDYQLSTSVLRFPAGTTEATFQIQATDDAVDEDDTETLILTATTGTGIPATHTVSINDNDLPPKVRMTLASQEVNEDAGPVLITAQLDQVSEKDVTIPLLFSGTAGQGQDWESGLNAAEIVILAGRLSGGYVVEILPDDIPEGNETILVELGTPINAVLDDASGSSNVHTMVIPFNDAPRVQWTAINKSVLESAGVVELTAKLSTASTLPITVNWSIIGGTATAEEDFTLPAIGTFSFAPGETEQTLTVPISDDATTENSESLVLELSSPSNAQLGEPVRAIASIIDNDRKVSLTTTSQTVWEDAGFAVVTAQISEPSAEPVKIPITVRSATAVEGEDYAVDQNVIIIAAGDLTGSVQIPIVDDLVNEEFKEEFEVILESPTNAGLDLNTFQRQVLQRITVRDDDPIVNFIANSYTVNESVGQVPIQVKLSAPSNKDVIVPFSLASSLSLSDDIVLPIPLEITIPAGNGIGELFVDVIDDGFEESRERLHLLIKDPVNALSPDGDSYVFEEKVVGYTFDFYTRETVPIYRGIPVPIENRRFRLTVRDNDGPLTATLAKKKQTRIENQKDAPIKIELNRPAPSDIVIPILVRVDSTAKKGVDFEISKSSIVIPEGATSGSVRIAIINDGKREETESVEIRLLDPIVPGTEIDPDDLLPEDQRNYLLEIEDNDQPITVPPTNIWQLEIDEDADSPPLDLGRINNSSDEVVSADQLVIGNGGDGYISGGTAFFDANRNGVIDFLDLNGNGVQDADEPTEPSSTTYADGTFGLVIPPEFDTNGDGIFSSDEGRYVVIGGFDASTGVPLEVALTGPAEAPAVSPLSTVLDHMLGETTDPSVELTRLLEAFELSQSDFLFTNTIWDAYQGKSHPQQVHRVNAVLHNSAVVISQAVAALDGAPPIAWIGDRTYAAMADAISAAGTTLDLQQSFVIDSLLRTVLDTAGLSADSQQIAGVANALAIVNTHIAAADAETGLDFLTQVAKAQAVAQDDLANDFANVFAGNVPLGDVLPIYAEVELVAKIAGKPARDVLPPAIAISDVRHIEGDAGQTFAELTVRLFQPSVDPVSVRYRTLESTADADIDYTAVDDILQWTPGDTSDRTILIPIHGDTEFEGDERVLVELYDPINSVLRRDLGTVYISEQDNLQYQVPSGMSEADLELIYEDSRILLIQNDEIAFDVLADSARSITITGASDQPTSLAVTLGDARDALAGGLVFVGQTNGDQLHVNNALEQSFEYVIESATSGRLSFSDGYIEYEGTSQYSDDVSPTINLPAGTLFEASEQMLTATTGVDSEKFATTYSWKVFAANDQVIAEGSEEETFAWTPEENGFYRVELTTTSAYRGEYTTSIPVTIENANPIFDADSIDPTFQVVENSANGTVVGTLTASDPAGSNDPISFTITGGTGSTAFGIDAATGVVSVTDSTQLDYETTTSFTLEVSVSDDDGGSATTTVRIDLLNRASIYGNVFLDADLDSLFDGNEDGLDNVTVELLDENGLLLESTTTSDGGFYLFEDYEPGNYQIRELQPTGIDDGPELLGSVGGTVIDNDLLALTLQREDASDYLFAEFGQSVGNGDSASIGFWQNKHGQALIASGGSQLAIWLSDNFANIFGDSLVNSSGEDVANFYRSQLFLQKGKKSAGPAKVDAQFMATTLSVYFTNRNLGGEIGSQYGLNVTDTGLATKIVNVGAAGAAFEVDDETNISIWGLLQSTNQMTDVHNELTGFAAIYDRNGDGVIDEDEATLRCLANDIYASINER